MFSIFASSNFVKLTTVHPNSELEIFFELCQSYCFNSTAHSRTWQDVRQVTFVAEALNLQSRWHVTQPDNLLELFSFRSIHFLTCGQCLHALITYRNGTSRLKRTINLELSNCTALHAAVSIHCRLSRLRSVTSPCMCAFGAWTTAEVNPNQQIQDITYLTLNTLWGYM